MIDKGNVMAPRKSPQNQIEIKKLKILNFGLNWPNCQNSEN
jgi:hypothetical protein